MARKTKEELANNQDYRDYLANEFNASGSGDYYSWERENEERLRNSWEERYGTERSADPGLDADANKISSAVSTTRQSIARSGTPDITDKILRDVRSSMAKRLMAGRGRKASFLTGPSGIGNQPLPTTFLGG